MNSDDEAAQFVAVLRESFNEAEGEIHRTESLTGRSPVSALNELRYSGSHMLVYLTEGNIGELKQAAMHGRRAFYDAQRFSLLFLMREAQAIRDGIGKFLPLYVDVVSKAYGGEKYSLLKKGLLAAKAYILQLAQVKMDGKRWEKRGDAHMACLPYINALRDYISVYDSLADEFLRLKEMTEEHQLADARNRRRNFILAVLSVIVTAIGVLVALFCR